MLREGNVVTDYMAKLGLIHMSVVNVWSAPLAEVMPLLQADALGVTFSKALVFFRHFFIFFVVVIKNRTKPTIIKLD